MLLHCHFVYNSTRLLHCSSKRWVDSLQDIFLVTRWTTDIILTTRNCKHRWLAAQWHDSQTFPIFNFWDSHTTLPSLIAGNMASLTWVSEPMVRSYTLNFTQSVHHITSALFCRTIKLKFDQFRNIWGLPYPPPFHDRSEIRHTTMNIRCSLPCQISA